MSRSNSDSQCGNSLYEAGITRAMCLKFVGLPNPGRRVPGRTQAAQLLRCIENQVACDPAALWLIAVFRVICSAISYALALV